MKGAKSWQIVVIVVGLLVGGASIGWVVFGGGGAKLDHRTYVVDVLTGERFSIDTSRGIMPPVKNPKTDTMSCLPVVKDEEGEWFINRRFLDQIREILAAHPGVDPAVDPESGRLVRTVE